MHECVSRGEWLLIHQILYFMPGEFLNFTVSENVSGCYTPYPSALWSSHQTVDKIL